MPNHSVLLIFSKGNKIKHKAKTRMAPRNEARETEIATLKMESKLRNHNVFKLGRVRGRFLLEHWYGGTGI